MEKEIAGTIHKNAMFLRNHVGSLKDADGNEWELSSHFGSHGPIIQSKQTGKAFTIEWSELLALAIEAGIEEA